MEKAQETYLNEHFTHGSENELTLAIDCYGAPLFQYCYSIVCNYHDAEDTVQTVFIKAFKKRRKFQRDTSLSAWLYTIAYHTCIDHLRKRKPALLYEDGAIGDYHAHGENGWSEDILQALAQLSAEDRAIIHGRIFDEMSYGELSAILSISEVTLRKRYERAKKS